MARRITPEQSFDAKAERSPDGCWLWTGYIDAKGYGVLGIGGKRLSKAHRFSYERFVGPIPAGKCLDHLCRVRHCVNPVHLEPVTNQENVIRGNAARPPRVACVKGHAFSEQNTYINQRGKRECRTCRAEAVKRYREKVRGTRN